MSREAISISRASTVDQSPTFRHGDTVISVCRKRIQQAVLILLNGNTPPGHTVPPILSSKGPSMNRRSFLWQGLGLCASVPVFTRATLSQQAAAGPFSKPSDADLTTFTRGLTGTSFHPGDPQYEQLRKGYAAKFDAHPALVVHPANSQDIQASLIFARSNHLPFAVRCGGHSYAGYSSCDGGLVLDMSGFRNMTIASDKSHARVGGGMLCGAVEIETAKTGVATVLGQCPSVGVGGFLLGGGVGPLMSKYGLGCDNILAAELVLADGRAVRASEHENPDLFWAIRGEAATLGWSLSSRLHCTMYRRSWRG
jgi:hypothetical protein